MRIKKQPISQIILIGDMPPNSPEEVVQKRQSNHGGEPFWGSKFPVTNHEQELRQITEAKIPVHAFFVNEYARTAFEAISRVANLSFITPEKPQGTCQSQFLNVNDNESGAELLCRCLTRTTLSDAGGATAVAKYDEIELRGGWA